jgi:twitching motility protein PilT
VAENPAGASRGENGADEPRINRLFKILVKQDASDLHLKTKRSPILRIKGQLHILKSDPLTDRQIERLLYEIMSPDIQARFEERGAIDFAHEFGDGWRVRINVFRQRGHVSAACRLVQRHIPEFEELNLPGEIIREIAEAPSGLVLMVGATGCGKSTTLGAMLQHINRTRRCHVLTIEDPIEFSYADDKAIINQREIGIDCENWLDALKFAVREDPDVILVGEMRDPATFQAGLTASETGHLVMGSMHAANCSQVIGRIMEMFPADQRPMVQRGLAGNLRAVIAQMLFPASKEGVDRVPAVEILKVTPFVSGLIERGEESKIPDVIRAGKDDGMIDMTESIAKLVEKDYVLRKVALAKAPNRDRLNMILRGINVGGGIIG